MRIRLFYELPESLRCRAVPLSLFWQNYTGYGWHVPDVLCLLEYCLVQEWAVLGVDVFLLPPDQTIYPDSWGTDKQNNESWFEYVQRSVDEARTYILHYPTPQGLAVLFQPILADELTFLHLSDDQFFRALREEEEAIALQVHRLSSSLEMIRHYLQSYIRGEVDTVQLEQMLSTLRYEDMSHALTRAERFRRDLLDYALGVISRIVEGNEVSSSNLEQLMAYLTGSEPFLGECLCMKA